MVLTIAAAPTAVGAAAGAHQVLTRCACTATEGPEHLVSTSACGSSQLARPPSAKQHEATSRGNRCPRWRCCSSPLSLQQVEQRKRVATSLSASSKRPRGESQITGSAYSGPPRQLRANAKGRRPQRRWTSRTCDRGGSLRRGWEARPSFLAELHGDRAHSSARPGASFVVHLL